MLQIAICDDEQFYREKLLSLVRQYLEQRDLAYTAQLYASGEQFLAQYENNVKYDIVFMDISMKELDVRFSQHDLSCIRDSFYRLCVRGL